MQEEDIMNISPHDFKAIEIKSKINPNYFGKLTFLNNGDIYSNIHTTKIGELKNNNIHEVIYKELYEGNWILTRNKVDICKNCIYNRFCPPISNFEFDIGQNNLCHFK